ncbi:MAG: flagellar hook-associated protein FlgK, partial [Acidobacteria bacterium]|nr:flagellar hook-associated protein FlgK [Acidobacteriota bacterium]
LDQVSLPFSPVNGSFQVQVLNQQTGLQKTTDIFVRLNGLDDDTTLEDLQAALDAIDGITAAITPSRRLTIDADSANVRFAFTANTSGILAALGLSTFFTGSTASDMGVSQIVRDDPAKFAASRSGIGQDTDIAIQLAGFQDTPIEASNGSSLSVLYDRLTGEVTQGSSVARSVAEGFRVFQQTLQGQLLAISGVSIDEEVIKMITFQRSYQAAARYIAAITELLDLLVNL